MNNNNDITKELSPQRELFLEYLFNDSECDGDVKRAAVKAGYSENNAGRMGRELRDEILRRTEDKLVLSAPKAVVRLVDMMDEDGSTPKADIRLKASQDVLDRVGVAKKQDIGITIEAESPIFFIPAKQTLDLSGVQDNDG